MNDSLGFSCQSQEQIMILTAIISTAESIFIIQQFTIESCEMTYVIIGQ